MENQENDREVIEVTKRIKVLKPVRKYGVMYYKDALQYLVKVIDQRAPEFNLILGLASFATANKLSDKQSERADEIISYYESQGIL